MADPFSKLTQNFSQERRNRIEQIKSKLRSSIEEDTLKAIESMIDSKIREHEERVGWVSGLIGVAFVVGIVHAIWLLKQLSSFTAVG